MDRGRGSSRSLGNTRLQLNAASKMVQGNGKLVTEEPKAGLLDALGLPVA